MWAYPRSIMFKPSETTALVLLSCKYLLLADRVQPANIRAQHNVRRVRSRGGGRGRGGRGGGRVRAPAGAAAAPGARARPPRQAARYHQASAAEFADYEFRR